MLQWTNLASRSAPESIERSRIFGAAAAAAAAAVTYLLRADFSAVIPLARVDYFTGWPVRSIFLAGHLLLGCRTGQRKSSSSTASRRCRRHAVFVAAASKTAATRMTSILENICHCEVSCDDDGDHHHRDDVHRRLGRGAAAAAAADDDDGNDKDRIILM